MKKIITKNIIFAGFLMLLSLLILTNSPLAFAKSLCEISKHDRIGNGWHMDTQAYLSDNGTLSGFTKLRNYNFLLGYTGGMFIVIVDENKQPIYTSKVRKWGINAVWFKRKKVKTKYWTQKIPEDVLHNASGLVVIQKHSPSYRVGKWVLNNLDFIQSQAKMFINIFQSKQLTPENIHDIANGIFKILEQTKHKNWVTENTLKIHEVITKIVVLINSNKDSWIPNNYYDIKELIKTISDKSKADWQQNTIDEIANIIEKIIKIANDSNGWVPDNIDDVSSIVQNIISMVSQLKTSDKITQFFDNVNDILYRVSELKQ